MKLAFYAVCNDLDYERDTFDGLCEHPDEILKMLNKLPYEQCRIYDADKYNCSTNDRDLYDFEEDYNCEDLDGGWWVVVIRDEK